MRLPLLLLVLLGGCGQLVEFPPIDAGPDAVDAAIDAATDAAIDAAPDAAIDAATDDAADAATDGG